MVTDYCEDCGRELPWCTMFLSGADDCKPVRYRGVCNDPQCREARDDRAIAAAIAAGVIDP